MTSRVLSLALVCAYIPMYHRGGPGVVTEVLAFCLLPLVSVWFSEPIGEAAAGWARPSPPLLVWLFGWITLLIPLVLKLESVYFFR